MKNYLEGRNTIEQTFINKSATLYIYFSPSPLGRNTNIGGKKVGQRFLGCNYVSPPFFPPLSRESRPSHWHFHRFHEARMNIQGLDASCIQGERVSPMQYANIIPSCTVSALLSVTRPSWGSRYDYSTSDTETSDPIFDEFLFTFPRQRFSKLHEFAPLDFESSSKDDLVEIEPEIDPEKFDDRRDNSSKKKQKKK